MTDPNTWWRFSLGTLVPGLVLWGSLNRERALFRRCFPPLSTPADPPGGSA